MVNVRGVACLLHGTADLENAAVEIGLFDERHAASMPSSVSRRAGLLHEFLEQRKERFIDATWCRVVAHANPRGLTHDLAHHAGGAHHAHGAEGFALHADVAAGNEEICDVAF